MAFNQAEEKRRAGLAYCLTKWVRPGGGGKIPATENGIAEHKKLVEAYDDIYGPTSAAGMRQYENVYALVRRGLEQQQAAEERAAEVMSAHAEKKEQADERRRAQRRENVLRRQRLEAERTLQALPQSMTIQRREISRLKEYLSRDEARVEQLEAGLAGKYRTSPLRKDIEEALADAKKRCKRFRERIPEVEADLAENKQACDEARAALKQGSPDPVSSPKPKPVVKSQQKRVAEQQKPRWNKPAFTKFREMQNIPKEWGVSRVVLIWRNKEQQDIRFFASDRGAVQRTWDGLFPDDGSTIMSIDHTGGERWDFEITRDQYRQIGE